MRKCVDRLIEEKRIIRFSVDELKAKYDAFYWDEDDDKEQSELIVPKTPQKSEMSDSPSPILTTKRIRKKCKVNDHLE